MRCGWLTSYIPTSPCSISTSASRAASRSLSNCIGTPPPHAVILISTHAEEDYRDLIAASPVLGFLSKANLSVAAIRALMQRVSGLGET